MASNAAGNDDYEPAYLSLNDFFVDPMAATFFDNQSPSTAQNHNLPAAPINTPTSRVLTELVAKPSGPPPFRMESNAAIFSQPTFSGASPMTSTSLEPASLVRGNTIYGSRCAPSSDRKFLPVGKPTHLGTVAARPCHPNTMVSRSYDFSDTRRKDTVTATPVGNFSSAHITLYRPSCGPSHVHGFGMQPFPQYAELTGHPSGIRHNYPPAIPTYSSSSYDTYMDVGYLSNYSSKDQHSAYQLPDLTRLPESRMNNQFSRKEYECAGFGTFLSDLNPKKVAIRKRCHAVEESRNPKPERCSKPVKSPRVKRKYTRRNSSVSAEANLSAAATRISPIRSHYVTTIKGKSETIVKSDCSSPIMPVVYSHRNIMAWERGQFLYRISDIHNADNGDDVLWCVKSNDLLQKYSFQNIDGHGNREYIKSDNFCGWIANESWRYYPINAVVRRSEMQESVVVSPFPSKDEIMRYRVEKLREMPNVDVQIGCRTEEQHNNVIANFGFKNDDINCRIRLSDEIAQRIEENSFIQV